MNADAAPKPKVVQIVGYKKSGKTTLACRLIERFAAAGLKAGALKHDVHGFEPDVPGTDSWRLRQAGALAAGIASSGRTAWFEERGAELEELLERMFRLAPDIIIAEGWKQAGYPKLALVQSMEHLPLLAGLTGVLAAVTWNDDLRKPLARSYPSLSVYAFDDVQGIADLVLSL